MRYDLGIVSFSITDACKILEPGNPNAMISSVIRPLSLQTARPAIAYRSANSETG